jgi:hypothetical protein
MSKQTGNKFSPEVRSRAVRLVLDQRRGGPTSCGLFRKPLNLPRTKCDGAHFPQRDKLLGSLPLLEHAAPVRQTTHKTSVLAQLGPQKKTPPAEDERPREASG